MLHFYTPLTVNPFTGQTQGLSTHSSSFASPLDSAIGSEFSTKAPSMVADGDLDSDDISGMFTYDPQQYNQQQAQGLLTTRLTLMDLGDMCVDHLN